ncbi:MAG: aspartate kinase [Christensenellales bacterium]|jgi:aspartate kinase
MQVKVAKFGGSSLADAEQFKKVAAIVQADPQRAYVVPSAPGKRSYKDVKVTDMLYGIHKKAEDCQDYSNDLQQVFLRFQEIIRDLGMDYDMEPEIRKIEGKLREGTSADYVASRGEYLSGLVLAKYLDYDFLDPSEGIFFQEDGSFDQIRTDQVLGRLLQSHKKAVIPGFFGSMPDGRIKTFSRGGSDVTGAIVARAANAALYENWTDVSGFLMCDPRIVHNPRVIRLLTYRELRELSYMGATVLHEHSIFPVQEAGIPINVRNTNAPGEPGTMIVSRIPDDVVSDPITGIAGRKCFNVITLEKAMMNATLGYGRRLLSILERYCIPFEHMPSGIDTLCLVVDSSYMNRDNKEALLRDIRKECQPDTLHVTEDIALIATVGHGMQNRVGMAARIFTALSLSNINIRMIDQGSSELNIIIGVHNDDFEEALRSIYHSFIPRS